jgi:hypothetical protein
MTERYLTITLQPDWKGALRTIGQAAAKADTYQGEVLNFESPGHFFGQLTEKRWEIVRAAQGNTSSTPFCQNLGSSNPYG